MNGATTGTPIPSRLRHYYSIYRRASNAEPMGPDFAHAVDSFERQTRHTSFRNHLRGVQRFAADPGMITEWVRTHPTPLELKPLIMMVSTNDAIERMNDTMRRSVDVAYHELHRLETKAVLPLREAAEHLYNAPLGTEAAGWETFKQTLAKQGIAQCIADAHDAILAEYEVMENRIRLFEARPDIDESVYADQLINEYFHNFGNKFTPLTGHMYQLSEQLKLLLDDQSETSAHKAVAKNILGLVTQWYTKYGLAMLTLHRFSIIDRIELIERQLVEPLRASIVTGEHFDVAALETAAQEFSLLIGTLQPWYAHFYRHTTRESAFVTQERMLFLKANAGRKAIATMADILTQLHEDPMSSQAARALSVLLKQWDRVRMMSHSFKMWDTLRDFGPDAPAPDL